ncbi:MAG: tetratricopeptide repeat protein [Pyrinomonadaceae bacterium]|nr:tetratricopeptide repeat protein [Pyrinomonadaceae bacterium]
MKNVFSSVLLAIFVFSIAANSQSQTAQRAKFDVTNYRIDANLTPSANSLQSTADVTFTPLDASRSFVFELNGALKVESVTRVSSNSVIPVSRPTTTRNSRTQPRQTQPPVSNSSTVTFVQDQNGIGDIGPKVTVDFGTVQTVGTPITLRFKYAGVLVNAEGGPLATKRLAAVDGDISYLLYASRWFPFHDYAADRATSEINVTVPNGYQVVGSSDEAVVKSGSQYRFVNRKPALIGSLAAGKFTNKTLRFGSTELQFYTRTSNDAQVAKYGEILGKAIEYYTKQYGAADSGNKLTIIQIDDDSLETYSSSGVLFLSTAFFETTRPNTLERLQREAAFQWWGNTVGLKSFDDAWLSQSLASYSSLELRESTAKPTEIEDMNRELIERALTFEQTASILRAPSALDDQSSAFQYIMLYKGASVFRLLRETLGKEKFNQLLKNYVSQYRGQNVSIDDFEKLSSQVGGTNLRYFFARWIEGTGVPEFSTDYQIIRTKAGKFIARGTVKQNYDNLKLPVEVELRSEGDKENKTQIVQLEDKTSNFNLEATGKPLEVLIDPNYKLLRIDADLRVSAIARRGIEQFRDGNYAEAQQQFEAALKLNRSNSWIYYHLGLLYLEQRNYDLAIDNFKATLGGDLRPTWLETWANIKMGNSYDAKGDRVRATSAYKKAQQAGYDYDDAQNVVKKYLASPYDPKAGATNTTAAK